MKRSVLNKLNNFFLKALIIIMIIFVSCFLVSSSNIFSIHKSSLEIVEAGSGTNNNYYNTWNVTQSSFINNNNLKEFSTGDWGGWRKTYYNWYFRHVWDTYHFTINFDSVTKSIFNKGLMEIGASERCTTIHNDWEHPFDITAPGASTRITPKFKSDNAIVYIDYKRISTNSSSTITATGEVHAKYDDAEIYFNIKLRLIDESAPQCSYSGTIQGADGVQYATPSAKFSFMDPENGIGIQSWTLYRAPLGNGANGGEIVSSGSGANSNFRVMNGEKTIADLGEDGDYYMTVRDWSGKTTNSPTFIRLYRPTFNIVATSAGSFNIVTGLTPGSGSSISSVYPNTHITVSFTPSASYMFHWFNTPTLTGATFFMNADLFKPTSTHMKYSGGTFYVTFQTISTFYSLNVCTNPTLTFGAETRGPTGVVSLKNTWQPIYNGLNQPIPESTLRGTVLQVSPDVTGGSFRDVFCTGYRLNGTSDFSSTAPKSANHFWDSKIVIRDTRTGYLDRVYGTFTVLKTVQIERKGITVGVTVGGTRPYNGGVDVSGLVASISGSIQSDGLSVSATSAVFNDKNVSSAVPGGPEQLKPVTVSGISIVGSNLDCYYLTNFNENIINLPASSSAIGTYQTTSKITRIPISKIYLEFNNTNETKVYDGTPNIRPDQFSVKITGVLSGDNVSIYETPTVVSEGADVGVHRITSNNVKLAGSDIVNYTYNSLPVRGDIFYTVDSDGAAAGKQKITITKKAITFILTNPASGFQKVYDGTAAPPVGLVATVAPDQLCGSNNVQFKNLTAEFINSLGQADYNVATADAVTVKTIQINENVGVGAKNYSLVPKTPLPNRDFYTHAANITKKTTGVSVVYNVPEGKRFDGSTNVPGLSVFTFSFDSLVPLDISSPSNISVSTTGSNAFTAAFATSAVGENITVNLYDIHISGASAGNYTYINRSFNEEDILANSPGSLDLTCISRITPKSLTESTVSISLSSTTDIYKGSMFTPVLTLSDSETSGNLVESNDYVYTISGNMIDAGTHTFTATGTGNYANVLTIQFIITKANVSITSVPFSLPYGTRYNDGLFDPTGTNNVTGTAFRINKDSSVSESVVEGTWTFADRDAVNGTIDLVGTYQKDVKFTVTDTKNYNQPANTTITATIVKRPIQLIFNNAVIATNPFGAVRRADVQNMVVSQFVTIDPIEEPTVCNPRRTNGLVGSDSHGLFLVCDIGTDSATFLKVNSYVVSINSESLNNNYTLLEPTATAEFNITPRFIEIIPDQEQGKVYNGQDLGSEPQYTYTYRDARDLGGNSLYPTAPASLILEIVADTPLYGNLTRQSGKNVGLYQLLAGTLKNDPDNDSETPDPNYNYDLRFPSAPVYYSITKKQVQISFNNNSKVYDSEPIIDGYTIGYSITLSDFPPIFAEGYAPVDGESLSGNLVVTGPDQLLTKAGSYSIRDANNGGYTDPNKNPNYSVTLTTATYTIIKRAITIHVDSNADITHLKPTETNPNFQKTYGSPDPSFTWYVVNTDDESVTAIVGSDYIVPNIIRTINENVGTYNITLHSVVENNNNNNYNISFASGSVLTINPFAVHIIPRTASRDYGVSEPPTPDELSFTMTPNVLPNEEGLNGGLYIDQSQWTHDALGNIPVGKYTISQGTVTSANNTNYLITFSDGEEKFSINKLEAHIKPNNGQSAMYGTDISTIHPLFVAKTRAGDTVSFSYFTGHLGVINLAGTGNIPIPVNACEIVLGTLASETHEIYFNSQYIEGEIVTVPATTFSITNRVIEIVPDETSQVFGDPKIDISTLYSLKAGSSLVGTDTLTGGLRLQASAPEILTVGSYDIEKGTLANPYYNITLVENKNKYIVTKKPVTVIPTATSSVYGNSESLIPVSYSPALIEGYTSVSGVARRSDTENKNVGSYAITIGTLFSTNYSFTLDTTPVYYSITPRPVTVKANDRTQVYGELPQTLTVSVISGSMAPGEQPSSLGTPEKEAGNTVGQYAINAGTIIQGNNPNYQLAFVSGTYTISRRNIRVVPTPLQRKVFGTPDPASFSYTVDATYISGALVGTDTLNGQLSRMPGEDAGSYKILQNNINNANNPNYNIDFKNDVLFSITRANTIITVTGGATNIADNNWELNLTYNASEQYVTADVNYPDFIGFVYNMPNRFITVGEYNIKLTAFETRNYNKAEANVKVTVTPYQLANIVAGDITDNSNTLTKVYGDTDAELKKTFPGLGSDGDIIVTYSRDEGETVGLYDIAINSLSNENYTISFANSDVSADAYEITKRTVTISEISPISITYNGIAEASATKEVSTPYFNDVITVTLTKTSGKNAGLYNIESFEIDSASAVNYDVNITEEAKINKFMIVPQSVTVTANSVNITYGDTPVELSYTAVGLIGEESLSGTLSKTESTNAGIYPIQQNTITNANNSNYNITYVGANYVVSPRPITIVPIAKTITYGVVDTDYTETGSTVTGNTNTYTITNGTLVGSDTLAGGPSRPRNINVGVYNFSNNFNGNNNYAITFNNDGIYYEITKYNLTIEPVAATKVYGDPMPNIEYSIVSGELQYSDSLVGNLSASGTNVGLYDMTIGSLVQNINYNITLQNADDKLTITAKPITIKAKDVYIHYGDNSPELTYDVVLGSIIEGDILDGALATTATANVGVYTITSTLTNSNYDIEYTDGLYEIAKRPLTIKLDNQSAKYIKDTEPQVAYKYSITEGTLAYNETIEVLNLTIQKAPGTKMGEYPITGSYDSTNYIVTFENGVFTILKYSSKITTAKSEESMIYTGKSFNIEASINSGAEIIYTVDNIKVENSFTEPGRYNVVLSAEATDEYYAPENVTVNIVILRGKLETKASGIDIIISNEDGTGYDPELKLEMVKAPTNSPMIKNAVGKHQEVLRSFDLKVVNSQSGTTFKGDGQTKIKIKAPEALKNQETIKVLVTQGNNNTPVTLEVPVDSNGYILMSLDNPTSISFIKESKNSSLIYIIIGAIALIVVVGIAVFIYKKR